jgi:predicted PurR-regulated permease PerM
MNLGQWFGFVCFIIALFVLWQIKHLLLLIFTAVVISVALNRFVKWLESKKITHKLAVICAVSSLIIFFILFILLVVPPFSEQLQKLLEELPQVWEKVDLQIINIKARLPENFPSLPTREDLITRLPSFQELFSRFVGIFSNSITAILETLLVFAIAVMMLASPQRYRQAFLSLFPSFYRRRADTILTLSETALGSWLQGTLISCLFIGFASGIGLAFLQIRLVLVHALIAGIFNFIPNIGPTTSMIFPLSIAVLESPWKIAAVFVWYFIIQNVESYWLSPLVMARQVSLLPAITLTAQIFFAQTFGIMGLLLALPLTVVAKTWIEEAIFQDILDNWQIKKRDRS